MEVAPGGCVGFRFGAGTEQACGAGADLELRLATEGATLRLEADGIRNLGMVALSDAASRASVEGVAAPAETVQAGATYVVQSRRQTILVRVVEVRGMEKVRSSAPAALRAPRASEVDAADPRGITATAPSPKVTLLLEWMPLEKSSQK